MLSEEKEILGYLKEAFSLRSQKLYKPAIEMLYKALNIDNDNTEVLFQLGEIYALMHNYERAIGYLEQVHKKNPKHIECLILMQQIYEKEEYYNEALNFAEKIYKIKPSTDTLNILIKNLGKLNQIKKILTYKDSEYCNYTTIYEIANALYKNNKLQQAQELLVEHKEEDELLKVLLGKIYYEQNDFIKSREIFTNFPVTTENPQILNYKGLFYLDDMDFVNAIKCFSKATAINKNNPIYFYNLGNAYFFNGWMKEAQNSYAKAIYLAPDNMDFRYSLCYLYYETNQYDKCKKEIQAILSTTPTHSSTKVLKALLLNREKDFNNAKIILEDNIKLGCDDDFTLLSLAKTYSYLDMFEKAESTIKKVIKRNPENIDYISDLADIYIKEKLYDNALKLIKNSVKSNPNYVYGYVLGAKTAFLNNNYDLAKEYAQEALFLDMNCSEGYYYLALVRFNEKDYDEAIECMKRAITYDVNNAKYYAEMSKIYKIKNDIKTAMEYISEAENLDNSTEYKIMYKELATLNRKNK